MIPREKGEIVEMMVIGELAKMRIHTARPLSDIFPFDLILIYKNRLLRCQIKSAQRKRDTVEFEIRKPNNSGTYNRTEIDLFILYDHVNFYIIPIEDVEGQYSLTLRFNKPNGRGSNPYRFAKDYLLTKEKILREFNK